MITVIGAGLAGLACAVALVDAGEPVTLIEAGPAAGGRCRSYDDRELGCRLDNGNHLLLSGNRAAHSWLHRLGTAHTLTGPAAPLFPFYDLATNERWTLRPNRGRIPWWVLSPSRRVPGTALADYTRLAAWRHIPAHATVADIAGPGPLTRRLIEPLAIAALNTLPAIADASLMAAIMRQTLLRGGRACIPAWPAIGLSESLIDPAVALLDRAGATIQFGRRVAALGRDGNRITALHTPDGPLPIGPHDAVVLAVPAPVATSLLPGLVGPDAFEAILNVHYRIDADPGAAGFMGLIGGLAEWVFFKPGIVSVTISAANRYADRDPDQIAQQVWSELLRACTLPPTPPPYRVVREKRATFAATSEQNQRRPKAQTDFDNLILAGDWTATGLPATIEGALWSGKEAAGKARALPHA